MNLPIVSILTTIYNREKYLAYCIDSVIASSYQDWEMIIVDDQSTDKSVEIAKEYEKKDPRIKVYVNEINLGDYPNRNKAASYAKGKYLKYLDADDLIYKFSLGFMVEVMEKNSEVNLALSHNYVKPTSPYPQKINSIEVLYSMFVDKNYLGVGPSEAIIRKSAFEKLGGFSGIKYIGDIELWVKLTLSAPIIALPPCLVYWREHEDQQIEQERNDYNIIKVRHLHKMKVLSQIKDKISSNQYKLAYKYTQYRYCRILWNLILIQKKPIYAFSLIKDSNIRFITLIEGLLGIGNIKPNKKNKHFI